MKLLDKIKKHLLLIVIMCAPLLAIIANSAYIFLSHSVVRPNYFSVACIDTNNDGVPEKYFPTLESAIDEANNKSSNDKIYLIPASEDNTCNTVYLFKDKTIASNDSLILPFRRNGDGTFNDSSWNGRQSGKNADPALCHAAGRQAAHPALSGNCRSVPDPPAAADPACRGDDEAESGFF